MSSVFTVVAWIAVTSWIIAIAALLWGIHATRSPSRPPTGRDTRAAGTELPSTVPAGAGLHHHGRPRPACEHVRIIKRVEQ